MRHFNTRRKIAVHGLIASFQFNVEIDCEHTEQQLESSAQSHGYRWMHQKCWLLGIVFHRRMGGWRRC